jgi:hypothetical protein
MARELIVAPEHVDPDVITNRCEQSRHEYI